jgi:class 3 adenylate cyclase
MAEERVERRLAAILAADVAGYSRLIGADEEGTLARLKAHRRELIDPKITEHRGRIVKTTGDGLLVEFASVVDAMRCATEMQAAMGERNAVVPADSRIEFRIGIHQETLLSRTATSLATASTSPHGSKVWRSPAVSASRPACRRTPSASSISPLRTSASRI